MRVLGIDPGSRITGWGLIVGPISAPRIVEAGVIRLDARGRSFSERLARLHAEIAELVRRLEPGCCAVEAPFHGSSARSSLQLAHARGVILAALAAESLEPAEYSPAEIKKAVVGNGRADKGQVAVMVERQLQADRLEGPADLTDALAVALCHLSTRRFAALVQGAS